MPLRSSVPTHQFRANFARVPPHIIAEVGLVGLTDEAGNLLVDDLGQNLVE